MRFNDIADRFAPDVLAQALIARFAMALIAHHGSELVRLGRCRQCLDIVAEGSPQNTCLPSLMAIIAAGA